MKDNQITPWMKRATTLLLAGALLATVFIAGRAAGSAAPTPQMAGPGTPAPAPEFFDSQPKSIRPAVLATTLSYYFISGNTFTAYGGSTDYFRQAIGCVNQMPLAVPFSAPVHLPQGSQVTSITLYTYDSPASTTTNSTAYFILNNGIGTGGYTVSANSQLNTMGYQQNNSTQINPTTIDNQNYNYLVEWRKNGAPDTTLLSLCGVRVAYYAPVTGIFAPVIAK